MNREFKFRAWDIYKKVFISTNVWAVCQTDFHAFGIMLKDWEDYREGEYFYKESQILQQYTGLKDRNGKEIYEGDILKYVDNWEYPNEDDTSHHLIYWDEEQARFTDLRIEDGDSLCAYEDGIYWISDSKVIGNKFENPELLEQ